MISENRHVFNLYLFHFLVFLLGLGLFVSCKSDSLPPGVPKGARYDRKTNLYSYTENGKHYTYYKSGNLYQVCELNSQGVRDGYCEAYLDGKDIKIKWGKFRDGQRDGEWIWTFEDGSIYIRQYYKYGKKRNFWIPVEEWGNEDGLYEKYFPDGRLEEKGFFESGYKTGNWVRFYPSGRLEYKGSYSRGKKIGEWEHYYPNGNLEAKESFTLDGDLKLRVTYYPNGKEWCRIESSSEIAGKKNHEKNHNPRPGIACID